MISLNYACKCGWSSGFLDDAQKHSNQSGHHVDVKGFLTPNIATVADRSKLEIADKARAKAREHEVLRRAREKGLVP